jgi:hypothetical protein
MKALRLMTGVTAAVCHLGAVGRGCEGARQVPVSVVRAGTQCPGQGAEPSVVLVSTPEGWRSAFPAELGTEETAAPPANFAREVVVVVGMGQRPTGGYAVELKETKGVVKDGIAAIQVVFRSPAPDAMVTQALTRPCLAVRLPRKDVREVKVADEGGRIVATAAVR